MDRDVLVERMAEAAYQAGVAPWPWGEMSATGQEVWRVMLRATLAVAEPVIQAAERERCAKLADEAAAEYTDIHPGKDACYEVAAAIRAHTR